MIRYAIILIAAMGTVAGVAALQDAPAAAETDQTVVEKNSPFPVVGPLVVTECKLDDCSDVPNQ